MNFLFGKQQTVQAFAEVLEDGGALFSQEIKSPTEEVIANIRPRYPCWILLCASSQKTSPLGSHNESWPQQDEPAQAWYTRGFFHKTKHVKEKNRPDFFDGVVHFISDKASSVPGGFPATPRSKQPPSRAIPSCRRDGMGS